MSTERTYSVMDRGALEALVQAGRPRPDFLYFWGHTERGGKVGKACLSQWYQSPFTADGTQFETAEHYMMAEKARLFGDEDVRAAIVAADSPREAKSLGRKVAGFDEEKWEAERMAIVLAGNQAKFAQNPALANYLISTGDAILVEASPHDRVWGIGLAQNDPRCENPAQWRGLNLLGFALMAVRSRGAAV